MKFFSSLAMTFSPFLEQEYKKIQQTHTRNFFKVPIQKLPPLTSLDSLAKICFYLSFPANILSYPAPRPRHWSNRWNPCFLLSLLGLFSQASPVQRTLSPHFWTRLYHWSLRVHQKRACAF